MRLERVAARLFNAPLAYHPGKAAAVLAALGGRITGRTIEMNGVQALEHAAFARGRIEMAGVLGDRMGRAYDSAGRKTYDLVQGCAIIPIEGSLVHKGAWLESDSGETSYQGLQTQVMRALADDAVKGVAFEIDSCGGEVSGAYETADMIHALSQEKPTMAILSDCAYSAAYLMASACRQIVVPERGGAGSIGVIMLHADMSKAMEQDGVAVTIISAGAHKADGNPFQPLPADVASDWRSDVEATRQTFAARVGTYRAGRLSTEQALATEARDYRGADAVAAGLCDGVGHPSAAFHAFLSELNRA